MAGSKVSDYGVGDVDLTALMTTVDAQRIGYHGVSLTEFSSDTEPKIAAGSKIEVNGALFKFDSDETIDDSGVANGVCYVRLLPVGDSITAEFTNDAPTWDDEKQGWYEAATNNRYLNFIMTKSDGDYLSKNILTTHQDAGGNISIYGTLDRDDIPLMGFMIDGTPLYSKILDFSIANSATTATVAHGISNAFSGHKIKSIATVFFDSTYDEFSSDDNVSNAIIRMRVDDTNIEFLRSSSVGSEDFRAFIIYE